MCIAMLPHSFFPIDGVDRGPAIVGWTKELDGYATLLPAQFAAAAADLDQDSHGRYMTLL